MIRWHYGRGFGELLRLNGNFAWFLYHFFSFGPLTRHLFSPWRRLGEEYQPSFNPSALGATLIVNTLMRSVGLGFRLTLLTFGLLVMIIYFSLAILAFLVWLCLPLIILALIFISLYFIF